MKQGMGIFRERKPRTRIDAEEVTIRRIKLRVTTADLFGFCLKRITFIFDGKFWRDVKRSVKFLEGNSEF